MNGKYEVQTAPPKRRKKNCRNWRKAIIPIMLVVVCVVACILIAPQQQNDEYGSLVYQALVKDGYSGSVEHLLASLVGETVDGVLPEESAYALAVQKGYSGTFSSWSRILTGVEVEYTGKSTYQISRDNGFDGDLTDWLHQLVQNYDAIGKYSQNEQSTAYELACQYGFSGNFIEWLVSLT